MHTVRDLLIRKPPKIVMIDPRCTMLQTLLKMAEHGVGALLVADNEGNLAGIVTEHDISKGAAKFGESLLKRPVGPKLTCDAATWRRNNAYGAMLCVRAVDRLHTLSGMRGMDPDDPVQRAWRDVHAAASQVSLGPPGHQLRPRAIRAAVHRSPRLAPGDRAKVNRRTTTARYYSSSRLFYMSSLADIPETSACIPSGIC